MSGRLPWNAPVSTSLSHNIDSLWDKVWCPDMAEGINVRFAGELQRFVQSNTEGDGLYTSASEYIRVPVRRDYERSDESNLG